MSGLQLAGWIIVGVLVFGLAALLALEAWFVHAAKRDDLADRDTLTGSSDERSENG